MSKNQNVLTLRLLGELQILYNERSLAALLAQKEQALLIYLACQPGQRFSREHLADLLWGETSQSQARYNLRRALWRLRRALTQIGLSPETCLTVEGPWIYIPPAAPCRVDVLDFEQILQACFQDLQSHFSLASGGICRIREALALYRGDFLTGFLVPNAPDFEEWLVLERERLFLLLLRALTSLIQGFIALGERDEAIAACQRILTLDPLQEDIHRLLMRLYWENGQRAQALRQYRTCQDLLQRELGIEPLKETQDLYQRILQYEASPVSTSSLVFTTRLTPPTPAPESLARPRLLSLLDRGLTVRLTLLSAPPGYGKTTLVAQWLAARSQTSHTGPMYQGQPDENPLDGLSFACAWYKASEADNAPLIFIEGLAASMAQSRSQGPDGLAPLELPLKEIQDLTALQGDPRQAAGLLVSALASMAPMPFVIIIDDVEHLTSPDSQKVLQHLVEHLPANGHLYLLTRVDPPLPLPRLRVQGQLLELRASDLQLTDEEVRALLQRAEGLNLSPSEITELTTRAEGWVAPLWLAANAFSRFAASLDDVWEGLFAYLREEVMASQPPEMRTLLLRSAVLDRLNPALCQAVLDIDNPTEWLAKLEQHNLFLQRHERSERQRRERSERRVVPPSPPGAARTEPQYTYHPLFLAFLRAELSYRLSNAEIEALHRRAARAWEQQGDPEQALLHYLQAGEKPEIARLLTAIAPIYLQQGHLEPLAHWLEQLGPTIQDQHPHLTLSAGRLCQEDGRLEEARRHYLRAMADFEARQDRPGRGDSLLALAELELARGRYADGIGWGWQAITCWDEADIPRRTAALCVIGQLQAHEGNLAEAESTLEQARGLLVGRGSDHRTEKWYPLLAFRALRTQAWIAYLQGAYHRAMSLNHLAEQEARRDVPPEVVAAFHNPAPAILREWGEGEIAWEATRRRLEAARQIRDRLAISHAYTDLGKLYLDRGQLVEAESAFRQAIAEAEAAGEDGFYRLYGEAHLVYACTLQDHALEASQVAGAMLHRCQARDASPLESALARIAAAIVAGCHNVPEGKTLPRENFAIFRAGMRDSHQLLDTYQSLVRLNVRYGVFVAATLISLAYLKGGKDLKDRADRQLQARRYLAEALALAAAEGYIQTIVTSRQATLPLVLLALREGVEPRFIGQVLARMGPQSLAGVVEMAQAADPHVRGRAAAALGMICAWEKSSDYGQCLEIALATLERLTHDPDAEVRAAAAQACHNLHHSFTRSLTQ